MNKYICKKELLEKQYSASGDQSPEAADMVVSAKDIESAAVMDIDWLIKKLSILEKRAYESSRRGASNANYLGGQYVAYHQAIELIRRAMKGTTLE